MADSPLPRRNEKIVAGNVVLDGIDFFSPVRDGTAVTVALVYYAGGLQLCMQYDSRRITEAQADDLMATYLRRFARRSTWQVEAAPSARRPECACTNSIAEERNRHHGNAWLKP